MKRSAVIVHFDELARVVPLVGGYLKAYAMADPGLRAAWDVELYSESCDVKASRVIRRLVDGAPDLVAFSVYTWNAGLVRRLLPTLRGLLPPTTRILLGGVEVMNVAPRFVDPTWEGVAVCNGEGERTFRDLLRELDEEHPDLARVGGLTFARDGEWLTTAGQPRIEDLTEIASPWLSGVFDDLPPLEVALFETNRGCPFYCEFCFWGGAIGQKIHQQELERIKEELTYIGRRGFGAIAFCDANFGILPRDAEIAEHLVAVSREHGGPKRIIFNSSKVRPDRVENISRILSQGELLTRHVFSLQTMSADVLAKARRTGLERGAYREIQQRLNEQRLSSLVELLWPMPGETLESFKDGVDDLLRSGAQTMLIYPLIWLNNTGYVEHTAEYGVTTLPEDDPAGGALLVVETAEVPFRDYLAGLRFVVATYLLHDCRGLYGTLQLLDALGVARFRDVIDEFADWMDDEAQGPLADLWRAQIDCFEDLARITWRGTLADMAFHGGRKELDRLLAAFVASRSWWSSHPRSELLRAAFEYDLLCRPYVFLQTPLELGIELESLGVLERRSRLWRVRSPYDLPRLIRGLRTGRGLDAHAAVPEGHVLRVDHRTFQTFLMPALGERERRWRCTQAVQESARIEPRCSVEPAEPVAAQAVLA